MRNFGYARPEGYRKALRAMKLAEKFKRPVIVFVDTPAAYPGIESRRARRRRGDCAEPARDGAARHADRRGGERRGGSGGALGIAIGDRILMQEFAIYSVIPPEGCAVASCGAIRQKKAEAAEALKITAPDLLGFGVIDEIIAEPIGGAHTDYDAAARWSTTLYRALRDMSRLVQARLNRATTSSATWAAWVDYGRGSLMPICAALGDAPCDERQPRWRRADDCAGRRASAVSRGLVDGGGGPFP
ncbi:MAG: hypothetical protein QM736_07950 [Vicinamibacterales bacterium]